MTKNTIARYLVCAGLSLLCVVGFARTSKEVAKEIQQLNKQVESLKKEQSKLKKQPKVVYAKEPIRAGNITKRLGTVEINRRFECAYAKGVYHENRWTKNGGWRDEVCSKCSGKYYEWRDYQGQIDSSKKAVVRLEAIDEELDQLKDKLTELRKEKSELAREEREAAAEAKKSKQDSSKPKNKSDGAAKDYMIVDLESGKVTYEAMVSQAESNQKYQAPEYKTKYLVLRRVPAGTYWIGGPEDASVKIDLGRNSYHSVTTSKDYYFAIYELTVAQYDRLMEAATPSDSTEPKGGVSYNIQRGSAQPAATPTSGPIANLNRKTGLEFDCPTTSMFEIASRAGKASKWISGDSPDGLPEYAWLDGSNVPRPVGTKKPNDWGIYDTVGNQWEIGRDAWNSADLALLQPDPLVPMSASEDDDKNALLGNGVVEKYTNNPPRSRFSMRHCSFRTNTRVHIGCRLTVIDPLH